MKRAIFFLYPHRQKIIDNEFCSLYTDCGGDKMNTLGERLNYARKQKGYTQAGNQAFQSAKLLKELYDIAKELSEDEQLFLLDTVKSLKLRLSKRQ